MLPHLSPRAALSAERSPVVRRSLRGRQFGSQHLLIAPKFGRALTNVRLAVPAEVCEKRVRRWKETRSASCAAFFRKPMDIRKPGV